MSTTSELKWNLDRLGQWSEPARFEVTRERIAAYAAATNDEHPAHRSGELAPPVFPVVGALVDAIGPQVMALVPGEIAMRVVHGEQDFRYHRAIDPMPIHLNEDFAKAMGLPGIIVHGLCTMAFCSRAVVQTFCADDPRRLQRLAVRFSKIVQPSQTVTTSLWEAGDGKVVFEITSDNGNVAIKDGLAEIRS